MFSKKTIPWFFLIFLIAAIALVLVRLFDATSSIAGKGLATIGISILVAVLFTLFLISLVFTSILLLAGQKGWIEYRPGSLMDKFIRLWDDFPSNRHPAETMTVDEESATAEEMREPWSDEFALTDLDELLEFIANGKGRGRKSDTSDELRFRAVRDWSIMQMRGTSTKLQDFLDERFGNHVDGSPKVPVPTFYGWRKKFIKELEEYRDAKKK